MTGGMTPFRATTSGTSSYDTGRLTVSAPFTGWVRGIRFGTQVTLTAAVVRESGTGREATGVILPPGLAPAATLWFSASPFYGYTGLYQYTVTAAGSVEVRNTVAGAEGMQLSVVYALGGAPSSLPDFPDVLPLREEETPDGS